MSIIIKNLNLGLLITATLFILGSGCDKDKNGSKPCRSSSYAFTATSEFSPQQEVYNVGDTIYLNSTIPKTLYDNISLQNVDYGNSLGIIGNITTSLMDTFTHRIIDGFSNFDAIPIKGSLSAISNSPNSGINIAYIEEANYNFKSGFVLKKKGLFQLAVTNLGSKGIAGKDCTNAGFDMTVTNTNKHINLFQYALNYTPDAMLQKSIYCFRVR